MGRFSQWIAGIEELWFCGCEDFYYVPDEAWEHVAAYMKPCGGKMVTVLWKRERRNKIKIDSE